MMKAWVLGFAIVLSACAEDERKDCGGRFMLDRASLGTAGVEAAEQARDEWNRWAGRDLIRFGEEGCSVSVGDPGLGKLGRFNHETGAITLRAGARMPRLVLMHEFGHAVGLDDVDGPAIMATDFDAATFTDRDRLEAKRAGLLVP